MLSAPGATSIMNSELVQVDLSGYVTFGVGKVWHRQLASLTASWQGSELAIKLEAAIALPTWILAANKTGV